MTPVFGILLALACALATNVGFLYKHRGACAAPAVDMRRPLRSAKALFGSRLFAIGMVIAAGSWIVHVAALSLAPLLGTGTLLIMGPQIGAPREHHGFMLGAAAGILFGVSDVSIKAISGLVGSSGLLGVVNPWLLVAAAASVAAFYASAKGLQDGHAV